MLKNNVLWPASRRFKSRTEWEPIGFFAEALCNSTQFDLKLGFFSSTAINVLSDGVATFLYNGGRMRMVINDILSEHDIDAMTLAESDTCLSYFDLHDLNAMQKTLSERDRHFFECLAWLMRNDRLEIKIVTTTSDVGIAHSKCGVFSDGLNRVGFDGSCNFSRMALINNIESITAFCDWDGQADLFKVEDIANDFEYTFSGEDTSVQYLDAANVRTRLKESFPYKEVHQLLEDEARLIAIQSDNVLSDSVRAILSRTRRRVEDIILKVQQQQAFSLDRLEPCFPFKEPREYQKEAFEKWKANGQKGLFAMATGTGKTLTALNCLLEIFKRCNYYKALILVPTQTLVDQWEDECKRFHFDHIIKAYSKNSRWRRELEDVKWKEDFSDSEKENSYIIISTYASFAREYIFHELVTFKSKTYRQLLFIADEAHNMGARRILDRLSGVKFQRRIGLSATPERQFDERGNYIIKDFFGCSDGFTFTFDMQEAIDKGFLCRYKYFPHLVHLTEDEMSEYMKISLQLAKFYNSKTDAFPEADEILLRLLLKRKRIVHKAKNKETIFRQILEQRYKDRGNLRYSLIYVPEGARPDENGVEMFANADEMEDDEFSNNLIDTYTGIVQAVSPTTTVRKFTANVQGRSELLEKYASGEIEVLTSMKCLDEGVDVPRSELAIFCASTGNPRQFIQRRGRILRTHPDKHMAEIHDLVVAPIVSSAGENYAMEKSLLRSELNRVRDFARISENSDYAYTELEEVLSYYQLPLY